MFKRSIKLFLLTCVIGLSSLINVNADALYDKISPGDVIIGNTVFKGNTWISANRAAEAGSLYTLNTGEINKNTYLYDDLEDWYKYNNNTEKYELLSSLEINELRDIIHIYYENNKPIVNTYKSYVEYEYDEEYDEEYISDANDVYWFYNEMYGEIFLDDENVELDYENETITCPYHYVFDFQVVANNEGENFKGICGVDDFEFVYEEEYNLEEISIESIELTSSSDYPNLINQDKVDFSDGYIEILEDLEVISYESNNNGYPPLAFEGKYIAFDIHFNENNNVHYYSIMERFVSNEANYYTEFVNDTTLRLFLPVESYGYSASSFLLIDNMFNKYETLYFGVQGFEKPTYDLTIENVEKVDSSIVSNNSLINSINAESEIIDEHEYKFLSINIIGELSVIEHNPMSNEWIAVDLILNEEVKSEYLDVDLDNDHLNTYEIIGNKIRLYLVEDTHVYIRDELTSSYNNNSLEFGIRVNKYGETSYITYDNGFNGVYGYYDITGTGETILSKTPINYSSYNDVYYDEVNSRMYYKNPNNILFMGDDSLKTITGIGEEYEEFIIKDVELYLTYTAEGETYYSDAKLLDDYDSLFDYVSNELEIGKEDMVVTIYTFFNRELTEEEQAEFDKFNDLVSAGKVEIVDISSSIYE